MPARKKAEPLFLNRELSLLQFNERVLAMAEHSDTPLLERLRYVCIVSSNLDEFFEIRVSSLREQLAQHPTLLGTDGMTTEQAYERVQLEVHSMVDRQYALLNDDIYPRLRTEGIYLHHASEWNEVQTAWAKEVFHRDVMPLLTPIGGASHVIVTCLSTKKKSPICGRRCKVNCHSVISAQPYGLKLMC